PVGAGGRGAGDTAAARLARVAGPREHVHVGVASLGRRLRTEAAAGRVAKHLVALVDDVAGTQRPAPVLAGVDDEVLAASHLRDLLAVADLLGGPVEVRRVEEEAL